MTGLRTTLRTEYKTRLQFRRGVNNFPSGQIIVLQLNGTHTGGTTAADRKRKDEHRNERSLLIMIKLTLQLGRLSSLISLIIQSGATLSATKLTPISLKGRRITRAN